MIIKKNQQLWESINKFYLKHIYINIPNQYMGKTRYNSMNIREYYPIYFIYNIYIYFLPNKYCT